MAEAKEAAESLRKAKETFAPARAQSAPAPAAAEPDSAEPIRRLRQFAREIDRLFEHFGLEHRRHAPTLFGRRGPLGRQHEMVRADWIPQIDLLEKPGQWIVRADLPGMTRDEVRVDITRDSLTIQGERKQEHAEGREGYHYCERSQGTFFRAVPLPEGAETAKASATFRNGVLEVVIPHPKEAEPRGRRLEIKG